MTVPGVCRVGPPDLTPTSPVSLYLLCLSMLASPFPLGSSWWVRPAGGQRPGGEGGVRVGQVSLVPAGGGICCPGGGLWLLYGLLQVPVGSLPLPPGPAKRPPSGPSTLAT